MIEEAKLEEWCWDVMLSEVPWPHSHKSKMEKAIHHQSKKIFHEALAAITWDAPTNFKFKKNDAKTWNWSGKCSLHEIAATDWIWRKSCQEQETGRKESKKKDIEREKQRRRGNLRHQVFNSAGKLYLLQKRTWFFLFSFFLKCVSGNSKVWGMGGLTFLFCCCVELSREEEYPVKGVDVVVEVLPRLGARWWREETGSASQRLLRTRID